MPVIMCYSVNTFYNGQKRGIMVKILAVPSERQNTDIRAMYGKKGVKNVKQINALQLDIGPTQSCKANRLIR